MGNFKKTFGAFAWKDTLHKLNYYDNALGKGWQPTIQFQEYLNIKAIT